MIDGDGLFIQWEVIIGIGIPLGGLGIALAKYFWKKEKCFIALKNKIDSLAKHDSASVDEHDGIHEEMEEIKQDLIQVKSNQVKNEIYLKLLLDDANIKYD